MAAAVSYNGTKMATGVTFILTINDQKHWTTTVQTMRFGWN